MTRKTDKVTKAGAVELSEDALDQASGGTSPAYIKFDLGHDQAVQKVNEVKLSPTTAANKFTPNQVKL